MKAGILLVAVMLAGLAAASEVRGVAYEWEDLTPARGAVLRLYESGRLVEQRVTDSNGAYSFTMPAGNYTLEGEWRTQAGEPLTTNVSIVLEEGDSFVLDLLLLPSFELEEIPVPAFIPEEEFPPVVGGDDGIGEQNYLSGWWLALLLFACIAFAVVAVLAALWLLRRKPEAEKKMREEEEPAGELPIYDDTEKVRRMVWKRRKVSQQEIIESTGFSPAKVSMILGELERAKKIRREKIGRKKIITKK